MGSLNPWLLASVAAVAVGTILLIVSVATPAWSVLDVAGNKSEIGPFKSCESNEGFEVGLCFPMGSENNSVSAVKAMTIIGLLGAFGALAELVYGIVVLLSREDENYDPNASEFAGIVLLFTIIGDIVWGAKVHGDWDSQQPYELGYSFALSIVGAIIVTIGGELSVLAEKNKQTEQATENE